MWVSPDSSETWKACGRGVPCPRIRETRIFASVNGTTVGSFVVLAKTLCRVEQLAGGRIESLR